MTGGEIARVRALLRVRTIEQSGGPSVQPRRCE